MKDTPTYNQADWEAIARYLSNEMEKDEKATFEGMLKENPAYQHLVTATQKDMQRIGNEALFAQGVNTQAAWVKVQHRMQSARVTNSPNRQLLSGKLLQVAAVLLALLAFGFGGILVYQHLNTGLTTVYADAHEMGKEMVLSDGSTITLNAGAELTYPKKFNGDVREVQLKGEAFFSIAHNEALPFVVHTNNATIQVLGTQFNVKAAKQLTEVLVTSGKVRVHMPGTADKNVELTSGDFCTAHKTLLKQEQPNANYLSWKTRKVVFDATPLHKVMQVVEQTYGVQIQLPSAAVGNLPFTATFEQEPLEIILESIAKSFNLTYETSDRSILFLE